MQEAVQGEIMKLSDNGIIYAISDSEWVNPVHVVPKKSSFTVVKKRQARVSANTTTYQGSSMHRLSQVERRY